ncbi:hypothetical protein IGB42_03264 [Andreprevotia sp. IGB-42]|uniref:hypothetical protein n=1 Tax=Andreprevotia sp. IGB-42 TaxID=2497473 RepID=UPI00135BA8D2|nr:hypothetical protein [Andreprevotia sp. IGB-42]KAF0812274.1 hypothetical protein IGB42_03264 [Andreprevotia sp. IGB-42]
MRLIASSSPVTRLLCILLAVILSFSGNLARADDQQATAAAVAALLSYPQTVPPDSDGWGHAVPEDFAPLDEHDEATLIDWLDQQRQQGADLNVLAHGGTLLHHAIRAGMNDTALWLLANGADPLKEGEHDALELALVFRRDKVFQRLVTMPGMRDALRSGTSLAWHAALSLPWKQGAGKLARVRVPLPAGEQQRQTLKTAALLAGNLWVLRVLTSPDPDAALRDKPRRDDAEVVDARLPQPLMPELIANARMPDEVDLLFRQHLRRPFGEVAFAGRVVRAALMAPRPVAYRVLEHLPAGALGAAFHDADTLARWWAWYTRLPASDQATVMMRWGKPMLANPEAILNASMQSGATWFYGDEHKQDNVASAWGKLLAGLHTPLPPSVQGKLWMFVPQQHRFTLLKLGYRPDSEELRHWFDRNDVAVINEFWPVLLAQRPEWQQRSYELLFAPLQDGYYRIVESYLYGKVLPFTSAADGPSHPYRIEAGSWLSASDATRQLLLQRGWVTPPPAVGPHRFVAVSQTCNFRPTPAWRRMLADMPELGRDRHEQVFDIDAVVQVTSPGQAECSLLVWGGSSGGRDFIDEDGFHGLRHFTPCVDGDYAIAMLSLNGDQIEVRHQENGLPYPGDLIAIQDISSGAYYWLGGQIATGGCGLTPAVLLQPDTPKTLKALPLTHPAMQALQIQCGDLVLSECVSAPIADVGPRLSHTMNVNEFANQYWPVEHQAFVQAALDGDTGKLTELQADGVFGSWLIDALAALNTSDLPISEKRRRVAWLLKDPVLLHGALQSPAWQAVETEDKRMEVWMGLLDWLPAEDWDSIIQEDSQGLVHSLSGVAAERHNRALACRLAGSMEQTCTLPKE